MVEQEYCQHNWKGKILHVRYVLKEEYCYDLKEVVIFIKELHCSTHTKLKGCIIYFKRISHYIRAYYLTQPFYAPIRCNF